MLAGKPFLSHVAPNWVLRREIAVSATDICDKVVLAGSAGVLLCPLMGWRHRADKQRVTVLGDAKSALSQRPFERC